MLSDLKPFPHFIQLDKMDCGPTCLRIIAKYYGRNYTLQYLRERSFITREGVSHSRQVNDLNICKSSL